MTILITGGTGLIGSYLQKELLSKGHQIIVLSRSKRQRKVAGITYSQWDVDKKLIDTNLVCTADYIIHLVGASIAAKRWSDAQKKIIINSRVKSTELLFKTLKENSHNVKGIVSASGSDSYGLQTTDNVYKETDHYGNDFLAKVCNAWENAVLQFDSIGVNTTCLRTGVVFAAKNSALQKMMTPIKMGIGSPIGSGKQILSYIHIKDLCNLYIHVVENNIVGVYNAVAANDTNEKITKKIAALLKVPLFMPNVPSFVFKLLFGEMATILLEGSAVDNAKIKQTGFVFKYPDLDSVLNDVIH